MTNKNRKKKMEEQMPGEVMLKGSGHDCPVCDSVLYGPLHLRQYLLQRVGAQGISDCHG